MAKKKLEELNRLSVEEYKQSEKLDIILIADNIRSGLNVGSLFRTLDCFSLKKLILCGLSPQPPHKEITKSAIGATHSVEWKYFPTTLEAVSFYKSKAYKIIGIEQTQNAVPFHKYSFGPQTVIVMGNEVDGLSEDILPLLDASLEIQQFGTKHSLNVSVCAGIVVYEASKQLRYSDVK